MSDLSHTRPSPLGPPQNALPHPAQILGWAAGAAPVRLPDMHRRTAAGDAVDVLLGGLLAARELISRYQRLQASPGFGPVARGALAQQLCAELAVHLHIEQEIFYPALRLDGMDSEALDMAEVGHEGLLAQVVKVSGMQPAEPLFDARVQMIAQLFDQHLHLTMAQLYPLARQSSLDLRWLGAVLWQRRGELLDELRHSAPH